MGEVEVTASALSFRADGLAVSGIYLQPSMSPEDVAATLRSVSASAVVLGDVNARLPWLQTQSGRPGPPERVKALSDFSRSHGFTALQASRPDESSRPNLPDKTTLTGLLTLDHCFVKLGRTVHAALLLLDNSSVGVCTDHAYTLHLRLAVSGSISPDPVDEPRSVRFHLGKLADEGVRRDMCAAFDEGARSLGLLSAGPSDPVTLDRRLVTLIQSICRRFLGQRVSRPAAGLGKKVISAKPQDPQVSTLLYKSAAAESRENGDILPSERGRAEGLSALQEIAGSLADRYAGRLLASDGSGNAVGADQRHDELSEDDVAREVGRQDFSHCSDLIAISPHRPATAFSPFPSLSSRVPMKSRA